MVAPVLSLKVVILREIFNFTYVKLKEKSDAVEMEIGMKNSY
jgi:hypothetical protein